MPRSTIARLTAILFCVALVQIFADGPSSSGIDAASMEKSVAPGDDFYTYANGRWMTSHPIPAENLSTTTAISLQVVAE